MRRIDDHYEYICVYVDDLVVCSKEPQGIIDKLTGHHKFNLKETGPIHFHLLGGCDYSEIMMIHYVMDHAGTLIKWYISLKGCLDTVHDHIHHHWKRVTTQKQMTVSSIPIHYWITPVGSTIGENRHNNIRHVVIIIPSSP
jgi:hypothetical protein